MSSDDGSWMGFSLFATSAITCAAILYDVTVRYILKAQPEPEAPKKVGQQAVVPEVASFSADAQAIPGEEVIKPEQVLEQQSSITILGKGKKGIQDTAKSDKEEKDENNGAPFWTFSYLLHSLVEALKSHVDLRPPKEGISDQCRDAADEIARMESVCNRSSADLDECAVSLVKNFLQGCEEIPEEAAPFTTDGLIELQKNQAVINSQWACIRRLMLCVDVHLCNAADYHQFHTEAAETGVVIEKMLKGVNEETSKEQKIDIKTSRDLDVIIEEWKVTKETIKFWESNINRLEAKSKMVVPVHLRTDKIEGDPPTIRALCSYKNDEVTIMEGEGLVLLDNQSIEKWKVKTHSGIESDIPSVCCLIPPPDDAAVEAASKLIEKLADVLSSIFASWSSKLLIILKQVFQELSQNKKHLFKILHPESKEALLKCITGIEEIAEKYLRHEDDYPAVKDTIKKIRDLLQQANTEGKEDDNLMKEGSDMMYKVEILMRIYEVLVEKLDISQKKKNAIEAERSDEARSVRIGINYKKETTETSSYTTANKEVRTAFSITGVVNPADKKVISMAEAEKKGILDRARGIYNDPKTGKSMPITEAISNQLIIVGAIEEEEDEEETQSVGLVSVTISKETRPYTITAVLDPRYDSQLTVSQAIEKGLYDEDKKIYINPENKEEFDVASAIDIGFIKVSYDIEAEQTEPETTTYHFAVYGVLDPFTKKRVPYHDAVEKGYIDKESGVYHNKQTGEDIPPADAIRNGLVKARQIESPDMVDNLMRGRTASMGSSGST